MSSDLMLLLMTILLYILFFVGLFIYFAIKDRFEKESINHVKSMMHNDLKEAETIRANAQKELQAAADKGNIIVNNACAKADEIIKAAHAEESSILDHARMDARAITQKAKELENSMIQKNHEFLELAASVKEEALHCAPFLAQMYSDCLYLLDLSDADYLTAKKRPAFTAAEIIKKHAFEKKELRTAFKQIQYQLSVYESLFPWLSDLSDATTADLLSISSPDSDFLIDDPVHNYVSKEEWASLSTSERNQLALDRYNTSHQKTKWQIGRDYELYVGSIYQKKGYSVDYSGSRLRYDDLGRDLLVRKGLNTIIIQCKYWSKEKQIHEKHVFQLYGTSICYKLDHPFETVKCMLITNAEYTQTAYAFAKKMDVTMVSNFPLGSFPQIKCNIGNSGEKIYHLPMDQQYDSVVISKPNEFFASTVAEAEQAGFRRAFKWHNS